MLVQESRVDTKLFLFGMSRILIVSYISYYREPSIMPSGSDTSDFWVVEVSWFWSITTPVFHLKNEFTLLYQKAKSIMVSHETSIFAVLKACYKDSRTLGDIPRYNLGSRQNWNVLCLEPNMNLLNFSSCVTARDVKKICMTCLWESGKKGDDSKISKKLRLLNDAL